MKFVMTLAAFLAIGAFISLMNLSDGHSTHQTIDRVASFQQ